MTTRVVISGGWYNHHGTSLPEDHPGPGETLEYRANPSLVDLVSNRMENKFSLQYKTRTQANDEGSEVQPSDEELELTGDLRIAFVPSTALPFCCINTCPVDGTERIFLDYAKIFQAMTELSGDATLSDEEKVRHLSLLAELGTVDLRTC